MNSHYEEEEEEEERDMTEEEEALYNDAVFQSQGFDVPKFPPCEDFGRISPLPQSCLSKKWILKAAYKSVEHFNHHINNNETDFEFVEIEKANIQAVRGLMYYITMKIKPMGAPPNYPTTTLQSKILNAPEGWEVEISRIKPTN